MPRGQTLNLENFCCVFEGTRSGRPNRITQRGPARPGWQQAASARARAIISSLRLRQSNRRAGPDTRRGAAARLTRRTRPSYAVSSAAGCLSPACLREKKGKMQKQTKRAINGRFFCGGDRSIDRSIALLSLSFSLSLPSGPVLPAHAKRPPERGASGPSQPALPSARTRRLGPRASHDRASARRPSCCTPPARRLPHSLFRRALVSRGQSVRESNLHCSFHSLCHLPTSPLQPRDCPHIRLRSKP